MALPLSRTRRSSTKFREAQRRAILVRYVWLNISPQSARMDQSFSPDGGKTWDVNWICELSR
jgi:hypothetical protein